MIEPNWNIFLWMMLAVWALKGMAGIIAGAMGKEKETKYDIGDVGVGLITLILVAIILIL